MTTDLSDIKRHFVRAFAGPDGAAVLRHLRRMTIEKAVGPNASDADLRWDAAGRAIVRYIEQMAQPDTATGAGDTRHDK